MLRQPIFARQVLHETATTLACLGLTAGVLRMLAFLQSFAWTNCLLAELFPGTANPSRAAASFAQRLLRRGLLKCGIFDVQAAVIGKQSLWSSTNPQPPNIDALAYALEQRFAGASKPTRVYWPSNEFGKRYGTWAGAESYPCQHKLSHDVLTTAVWLHFLKHSPAAALVQWVPERWLQSASRRGDWRGPIPDALIQDGKCTTAIEIGGNYPAAWIRHHIERFEAAGWAWQLW